jgi:hypothetical protein
VTSTTRRPINADIRRSEESPLKDKQENASMETFINWKQSLKIQVMRWVQIMQCFFVL